MGLAAGKAESAKLTRAPGGEWTNPTNFPGSWRVASPSSIREAALIRKRRRRVATHCAARDRPTRDGDHEVHLLTDLPQAVADTAGVVTIYHRRWTQETAFPELEAMLNGESAALGYPRAAPFTLGVAMVAENVMRVVKGALRSVHGADAIDEGVSGSVLAEEVAGTTWGMGIAIPKGEWTVFHDLSHSAMGEALRDLERRGRLSHYRGPKRPKPRKASSYEREYLSTAKVLKDQQGYK